MNFLTNRPVDSRWASESEIKSSLYQIKNGDDNPCHGGIPLFADSEAVYVDKTDTHSLIVGSTGSKKTRLIGMPTLRLYARAGEAFIATDPKAELYERTLPLLNELGYKVFVLNLRDPTRSNSWNPLIVPYRLYHNGQRDKAIELVNDMASCIMNQGYIDHDPYWSNSASDLLSGLLLVLFECAQENEINFKSLRALRTQAFENSNDVKPYIHEYFLRHLDKASFIKSLLGGTSEVCDTTRGCILSVFDQAMRPFFSQDNLINMLSANDLDMRTIGNEKTAVFLIIPDENTLYHKLISVFIKQCYTELIIEAQRQPLFSLPKRVNFLLDEFSSLPQIGDFPNMITAARSRNIRFNLFVQSIQQLQLRYGFQAELIRGNCENWVFLHSRELSMLDELVKLSGTKGYKEPLISVTMLQTLDKDKGEAFILHKRIHPIIVRLPDIDSYYAVTQNGVPTKYPENLYEAKAVFDFEQFCKGKSRFFIRHLFSGKSLDEIEIISQKEEAEYYMSDDSK